MTIITDVEDKIKEVVEANYLKIGLASILVIVLSVIALLLTTWFAPFVSAYPAITGNVGFAGLIFYCVDRWVFKSVNTLELIKQGNNYIYVLVIIGMIICASIIAT